MEREIVSYVKRHIKKYPKIETIDIYKLIYQASFLAGHLIGSNAFDYLVKEANLCDNQTTQNELYEYISNDVVRVNLYPYLNYYSMESLFDLFSKCNNEYVNENDGDYLKYSYEQLIDIYKGYTENNNRRYDKMNTYKNFIKDMLVVENRVLEYLVNETSINKTIPSHSKIYKSIYKPSYRLALAKDLNIEVRARKVQMYIDQVKANINTLDKKVLIALEGRCASGKTTISKLIKDVTLIHIDDFFDEKKEDRLNYKELINLLNRIKYAKVGEIIEYNAFSCRDWKYYKKEITVNNVILFEGVYSYSEEIRDYFDKVIFSVISKDEQLYRLNKRENEYYLQKYLNEWIPREEEYYESFDFVSNANILI